MIPGLFAIFNCPVSCEPVTNAASESCADHHECKCIFNLFCFSRDWIKVCMDITTLPKASFSIGSFASSSSSSSISGEWENLNRSNSYLFEHEFIQIDRRFSHILHQHPTHQIPYMLLTFDYWQRVVAAPWWPARWWRRAAARKHHPPTGLSSPDKPTMFLRNPNRKAQHCFS